ncbi:MAG: TonB family protein [Candidatus Sulfotelmatobacter sp.]
MSKCLDAIRRPGHGGYVLMLAVLLLFGVSVREARAQSYETSASDERKVLSRVDPDYPEALKKLYIGGVVRVEVVVAPNGAVKSAKLLGGSPILGQSTMKAIKQWKYVPAGSDETLTVKVEFDPHR